MYTDRMKQQLNRKLQRRRRFAHARQLEGISRRRFLQATTLTGALAFATGCQLLPTEQTEAIQVAGMPKALPGFTDMGDPMPLLHFYLPTPTIAPPGAPTISERTADPSTIFDFNGTVGVFEPFGGTGRDGEGNLLYWAADVRFMKGEYIDEDGIMGNGAFAFL